MSVNEKTIEGFAELFHHYHNALGPDFGCGKAQEAEWDELTTNERKRLIAAARLAVLELQSDQADSTNIFTSWPSGTEGRDCGC